MLTLQLGAGSLVELGRVLSTNEQYQLIAVELLGRVA
jgi:hypothetical protein